MHAVELVFHKCWPWCWFRPADRHCCITRLNIVHTFFLPRWCYSFRLHQVILSESNVKCEYYTIIMEFIWTYWTITLLKTWTLKGILKWNNWYFFILRNLWIYRTAKFLTQLNTIKIRIKIKEKIVDFIKKQKQIKNIIYFTVYILEKNVSHKSFVTSVRT